MRESDQPTVPLPVRGPASAIGATAAAAPPAGSRNFLVVVRSGDIGRSGFTIEAAMNRRAARIRVALELKGEARDTARYFDLVCRDRDIIDEQVGDKLVWHAPVGRRHQSVQRLLVADVWDRSGRTEQYGWLLEGVEAMHRAFVPRIRGLGAPR